MEEKYINKILNFSDENICTEKELIINKEQAIERLKKMIQINNGVIKEARKNGDIFAMQLTADLDTDSIAIEKVLSMLEEKDKTISLMLEKFADIDFDDMCLDCECCVGNGCIKEERDLYENCIKQYFENKVKERR